VALKGGEKVIAVVFLSSTSKPSAFRYGLWDKDASSALKLCAINRTRRDERSAKGFPTTSSASSKIKDPINAAGIDTAESNDEEEEEDEADDEGSG
jgi:hypothetical protein